MLLSVVLYVAVVAYGLWSESQPLLVAAVSFSLGVWWNDWVGDLRRRLLDLARPWGTAFHD